MTKLLTPVSDEFLTRVALGLMPGWRSERKFGMIENAPDSPTVVASAGTYAMPLAGVALEAVSSSADDSPSGNGARSVTFYGSDPVTWEHVSHTVALNGLTPVSVPNMIRGFRGRVDGAGTYASDSAPSHNSTITLRAVSGAVPWLTIPTVLGRGAGTSYVAAYTSEPDTRCWIVGRSITIETTKSIALKLSCRERADIVAAPFRPMRDVEVDLGIIGADTKRFPFMAGPFDGPADIVFFAQTTQVLQTANVSIDFDILIRDLSYT